MLGAQESVASDAYPSPAVRKKTGKRPSVFGSLFKSPQRPEDVEKPDVFEQLNPLQATRPISEALDEPIMVSDRQLVRSSHSKGSDMSEQVAVIVDDKDAIFETSERKEPSRSAKPISRFPSKKELLVMKEALMQTPPRKEGSLVENSPLNLRREESKVVDNHDQKDFLGGLMPLSANSRKDGSKKEKTSLLQSTPYNMPKYISARLPALTIDQNDATSTNSFTSAQQGLDSRPRAESDPCPMWGSTLEDDFGFESTNEDVHQAGDEDILLKRTPSFQKPRTPSFNGERVWEGRRSLQLSVNNKDMTSGAIGTVHVSAATLDRLVEYVVTSNEFMEASQVSGFLLTYHSYINSQGLLAALASRYDISTANNDQVARIRTLYVLQRWIEEHWYDFESDDILLLGVVQFSQSRLKDFPDTDEARHDPCFGLLKKLASVQELAQSKLERKRMNEIVSEDEEAPEDEEKKEETKKSTSEPGNDDELDKIRKHNVIAPRLLKHQSKLLIKLEKAPLIDLPKDFSNVWHTKFEGKPMYVVLSASVISKLEIARQITVLEHNLYKKIPPTELIAQATKQLAKPPEHVRAMIAHFNDVSKFVAISICSFTDLAPRTHMFRRWIKIGRECLRLNNYNAVFEIMAGIHSVAVHRLHKTRGALNVKTKQILDRLEEVTSRKNNYATYRALLAQNTVPIQPAVPFIGATLTDLSFLDFGHRNVVENGEGDTLINFTKHRRVAQVMSTIKKFQDHPYLLEVSPELSKFLITEMRKAAELSDKDLYNMSLSCESVAQTAGGQAQAAFFEFPTNDAIAHKRDDSRSAVNFLFGHRKEDSKAAFLFKKS